MKTEKLKPQELCLFQFSFEFSLSVVSSLQSFDLSAISHVFSRNRIHVTVLDKKIPWSIVFCCFCVCVYWGWDICICGVDVTYLHGGYSLFSSKLCGTVGLWVCFSVCECVCVESKNVCVFCVCVSVCVHPFICPSLSLSLRATTPHPCYEWQYQQS